MSLCFIEFSMKADISKREIQPKFCKISHLNNRDQEVEIKEWFMYFFTSTQLKGSVIFEAQ